MQRMHLQTCQFALVADDPFGRRILVSMCFKEHGWSIVIKAYEVQKLGHKLIPNTSFLDETLHFRIFGLFTCNILQPIPIQTTAMRLICLDWTSFPPSVEIFPVCASTFSIPKILHTSDRNHKPLHDSIQKNMSGLCCMFSGPPCFDIQRL